MNHAVLVANAGRSGDDRVLARRTPTGLILCVADGAGGMAGGSIAAQMVVHHIASISHPDDADWASVLTRLDEVIASSRDAGQTTAVVAVVRGNRVIGASVGDSGALLFSPTDTLDLTAAQSRKPLLGSGKSRPMLFFADLAGRLLLATDGLLKYVDGSRIRELALGFEPERALAELVASARLSNGALQDDVALALTG